MAASRWTMPSWWWALRRQDRSRQSRQEPIFVAVQTDERDRPRRIELSRSARFTRRRIKSPAKRIVAPGVTVVTDGRAYRCRRRRLSARSDCDGLRPSWGSGVPLVQHDVRQHQVRDHRHLPLRSSRNDPRPRPRRRGRGRIQKQLGALFACKGGVPK